MDTWINPKGIFNILSITILEKYCYGVNYDTKEQWVIYIPAGVKINYKRDSI